MEQKLELIFETLGSITKNSQVIGLLSHSGNSALVLHDIEFVILHISLKSDV